MFVTVLLPLLAGEVLTILHFESSLRETAELELTNVVRHLYRSCEIRQKEFEPRKSLPTGEDVAFLEGILLSFRVGKTGYPYVIDTEGNLIIHPAKQGQNIYDSRDSKGFAFIQEICRSAESLAPGETGTLRYPWKNVEEGETRERMKIVKYRYFKDWGWIIAAGAYEEEIYQAIAPVEGYATALVLLSVFLVIAFTWMMNRLVTRPVVLISEASSKLAEGDLSQTVAGASRRDEVGVLARSFNTMAAQIREETALLERLVEERTQALVESREKYRSLVENTVDGIVTSDLSGEITFANSGMEKMIGRPREEIIGAKIWSFYKGGIEQARHIMRRLREENNITNYEMELIALEGPLPIMTSASLLRDADGKETGTLGIFSDITKLKRLEEDLRKAQVNLAQTMKLRALGDLVAGVAHEVNNPLMASMTMLHVIMQSVPEDETKLHSRLDVLKRCNSRIMNIVNHLRDFARQSNIERKRIDINEPLSNALLICSQQLMNMHISVEKDLAEDLPAINGDANHLEQVFLDVIANARDALEPVEGEKSLSLRSYTDGLDGNPAVVVEIRDTGPGISPEVIDKIFEPFFTTKPVGKGTGLGLPICYGIIEEHCGRIDVESEAGQGTTFTIRIPAIVLDIEPTQECEERQDGAENSDHG